MKAVVIKLKKKERKALEAIVNNIKAGQQMLLEGGKILDENRSNLWKEVRGMYPKLPETRDVSFSYEDYELRYFVPSNKAEAYRILKEEAVRNKDFEKAAKYRDLERAED